MPKRKPKPLLWSTCIKKGEIQGRARGKALAQLYIGQWEAEKGKPVTVPARLAACARIEENALAHLLNQPGWESLKVTVEQYSPQTPEGCALDQRIWDAFIRAAVCAIHETLVAYGCNNLRFLDMTSFVRYYQGG